MFPANVKKVVWPLQVQGDETAKKKTKKLRSGMNIHHALQEFCGSVSELKGNLL